MSMVVIVLATLPLITAFLFFVSFYFCCKGEREDGDLELGRLDTSPKVTQIPPLVSKTVCRPQTATVEVVSRWPRIFTLEELAVSTDDFSKDKFLGEGGFGPVYKGVLSHDQLIAVKMLKADSQQGHQEFLNEIETIGRIHHQNLVSMVGYATDKAKRFLVYEFLPNNSLRSHLHGKAKSAMKWPQRWRIALGTAKGLEYLHENCDPRIIHRDIKAENILLGDKLEPKIADFGLAKLIPDYVTHVTTFCKGTIGYLDPESFNTHRLTAKSDVYSYGVVLWELITGRRYVEQNTHVIIWVKSRLHQTLNTGSFQALVDPELQKKYDQVEMHRMICCAAACVYKPSKNRPRMQQIVRALEGHLSLEDIWNWNNDMPSMESCDSSSSQYMDALDILAQTDRKGKRPANNSSS